MPRTAMFVAIAFILLAGGSVECRAGKISPPDPTPGPGNPGGSSNYA